MWLWMQDIREVSSFNSKMKYSHSCVSITLSHFKVAMYVQGLKYAKKAIKAD